LTVRNSTTIDRPSEWLCASPWPVMLSSKAANSVLSRRRPCQPAAT